MGQRETAFTVEEENFYKVSHIVLDEIPTKLRDFFKTLWDTKYPAYPWIDTPVCGQRFLNADRNVQKHIRPHIALGDRKEWDGTTLFAVLLFSNHNLIQKNTATYQAIDNLRAVRNSHYGHLNCAKIDRSACQQITSNVKTCFSTLNWATNGISAIEQRNVLKGDSVRLLKVMQEEKARNDALEKRICSVENDVTQQQIVTAQIQTDVTQLEAESMQLKTGTARLQSDMAQVRADSVQLQGDVVQLQTDVEIAHIGIRQLGKDMETKQNKLETEVGDQKKATTLLETKQNNLEAAVRDQKRATALLGSSSGSQNITIDNRVGKVHIGPSTINVVGSSSVTTGDKIMIEIHKN